SARAGARIAFSCEGLGLEVCVMNADGSGRRTLTRHPANDFQPSWSPDGRRIAFASNPEGNSGVYVDNADGSGLRRLSAAGISTGGLRGHQTVAGSPSSAATVATTTST